MEHCHLSTVQPVEASSADVKGRHPCRLSNHRDYACAPANDASKYPRRTQTERSGSLWPSLHTPAHFLTFLPSSRLGCIRSTTRPPAWQRLERLPRHCAQRLRTPANVFPASAKRPSASQSSSEPVSPRGLWSCRTALRRLCAQVYSGQARVY